MISKLIFLWLLTLSPLVAAAETTSMNPMEAIEKFGEISISDGLSFFIFYKEGMFESGPLRPCGQTMNGYWTKNADGHFVVTARLGWINGLSSGDEYRRIVFYIGYISKRAKVDRPKAFHPTILFDSYFLIDEMTPIPKPDKEIPRFFEKPKRPESDQTERKEEPQIQLDEKPPTNMVKHAAWTRETKDLPTRIRRLEGFWEKYLPFEEGGSDKERMGYEDGSHILAIASCAWELARCYVEAGDKDKALKMLVWLQKDSKIMLDSSENQNNPNENLHATPQNNRLPKLN